MPILAALTIEYEIIPISCVNAVTHLCFFSI